MPSRARTRRFPHDLGVYGLPGDVSPWDIRFDPDDRAFLEPVGDGSFALRVWTEPSLTDGMVVIRDRDGAVTGHRLEPIDGARFTYWRTTIGQFESSVELSLAFRSEAGHPVYVVPSGVTNGVERLDRWELDPALAPVVTPDWAQGAVIYQIFPDRFANGDRATDPEDVVAWGSEPHPRRFHGGDLAGVVEKLEHLERLGVEAIYLNPCFTSPSTHRYDTVDYYEVDPILGGNRALADLVSSAHARGMRVVLDASFNHVHPRFFAFADLVRHGKKSKFRDWFVVHDWPLRIRYRPSELRGHPWVKDWLSVWKEEIGLPLEPVEGRGPVLEPTYDAWYSVPTMPRLDLSVPDARKYALDVATHWIREYGLDGWRMDVARYVDPDFWNDFRAAVKAVKPDAYLLSEIMGDSRAWLQGDRFDATMNYSFRDLCLRFFARDEIDGPELLDDATRLMFQYPWPVTLSNQNLLGSHDTPRFLTEAGGDRWRLQLATVFQLTYPGAPGIYYGDEVYLEGGDDPGCRGAFPWERLERSAPLVDMISELTALRRSRPALRTGSWKPLAASKHAVAFERRRNRSRLVVALNRSSRATTLAVDGSGKTLWGQGSLADGGLRVGGRSGVVVQT